MQEISKDHPISRRTVIARAALIPVSALTASAQTAKPVLSPAERQILEAFADCLVPKDEHGPSASECGVVDYIDRSLGDYLAAEKPAFLEGLAAVDAFSRRTRGAAFAELSDAKKGEVLTAMESNSATGFKPDARAFFFRVRQLTLEGMFGDPFYGGNRAYAGWELIRYPGPRLATSPEEQKIRSEIKPLRTSAYGAKYGR